MSVAATASPSLPRSPLVALSAWMLLAVAAGAAGLMNVQQPLTIAASIFSLSGMVLLAARFVPAVRELTERVDVRWLMAAHAIRLPIGAAFLIMYSQGQLPGEFAVRGGIGDMLVGALVLILVLLPERTSRRRTLFLAWNVVGFVDILLVVVTAQKILLFGDASTMSVMAELPWALIPLFVVPLVISTHLLLFKRLRRAAA